MRILAVVWRSSTCCLQALSFEHRTNPLHIHSSVAQAASTSNVVCLDQMHSLSVPVWLIIGQETGCAKDAKKGWKSYRKARCRIYTSEQSSFTLLRTDMVVCTSLECFVIHSVCQAPMISCPSRFALCRLPAVTLAGRSQQKMD